MQKVKALEPFTEDDGQGGEVNRLEGDEFSATNDRADTLVERGLVKRVADTASKRSDTADSPKADAPKE